MLLHGTERPPVGKSHFRDSTSHRPYRAAIWRRTGIGAVFRRRGRAVRAAMAQWPADSSPRPDEEPGRGRPEAWIERVCSRMACRQCRLRSVSIRGVAWKHFVASARSAACRGRPFHAGTRSRRLGTHRPSSASATIRGLSRGGSRCAEARAAPAATRRLDRGFTHVIRRRGLRHHRLPGAGERVRASRSLARRAGSCGWSRRPYGWARSASRSAMSMPCWMSKFQRAAVGSPLPGTRPTASSTPVGCKLVRRFPRLAPSGSLNCRKRVKDRIRVESAPQRLFGAHESDKEDLTEEELKTLRAEAEAYVAGLVAGAQRRVVFVDPDFGLREMQNYALRPRRDRVGVKILTSASDASCTKAWRQRYRTDGGTPGDGSVTHRTWRVSAKATSTLAEQTWSRCAGSVRDALVRQAPLSRPFRGD